MRIFFIALILASGLAMAEQPIAIAVHGGAGTIERDQMSPEREQTIRAALEAAVRAGHEILENGGSSLDAVVAAVTILEDAPEFNAGRGSVLTNTGAVEMDASIMDGRNRDAGAVAGVQGIRNPIKAAHLVMTDSPHVMLIGEGAATFARNRELQFEDEEWFKTDFRRDQLERMQRTDQAATQLSEDWHSTVGAVAVDREGNLAAATSTGGMANKRWGRVGDSPIIGAGTYADNHSCAVSATGHGEYFIRHVVAYDICARMAYTGQPLLQTADEVVNRVLREAGGDGGVIAVDSDGHITMPFNTAGMYRAAIHGDGHLEVGIYADEEDHSPDR
jgi:L-asparaginase / beta-aspartyl-peptidase